MAKSVHAYAGSPPMKWLPESLLVEGLKNYPCWAQHVKQVIMLTAGIETKRQQSMRKGEREDFMLSEYLCWVDIVQQKFPNAAVGPYLEYTTGTRATKVTGVYLYRNFTEGLRMFHKDFVPLWNKVLGGQTSGKSPEELWVFFCYLLNCNRNEEKPGSWYPESFSADKVEKMKWVLAFKLMGPPCETLVDGDDECHEFLANPVGLASRGTGTPIRKTKKLGRKAHREQKAKAQREVLVNASAEKHSNSAWELGRIQTITNIMKLNEKRTNARYVYYYYLLLYI